METENLISSDDGESLSELEEFILGNSSQSSSSESLDESDSHSLDLPLDRRNGVAILPKIPQRKQLLTYKCKRRRSMIQKKLNNPKKKAVNWYRKRWRRDVYKKFMTYRRKVPSVQVKSQTIEKDPPLAPVQNKSAKPGEPILFIDLEDSDEETNAIADPAKCNSGSPEDIPTGISRQMPISPVPAIAANSTPTLTYTPVATNGNHGNHGSDIDGLPAVDGNATNSAAIAISDDNSITSGIPATHGDRLIDDMRTTNGISATNGIPSTDATSATQGNRLTDDVPSTDGLWATYGNRLPDGIPGIDGIFGKRLNDGIPGIDGIFATHGKRLSDGFPASEVIPSTDDISPTQGNRPFDGFLDTNGISAPDVIPATNGTYGEDSPNRLICGSAPVVVEVLPEFVNKMNNVLMLIREGKLQKGREPMESQAPSANTLKRTFAEMNANSSERAPSMSEGGMSFSARCQSTPFGRRDMDQDIRENFDFQKEMEAQFPRRQRALTGYVDRYRAHMPHVEDQIVRIDLEVEQLNEMIQQRDRELDRLKYLRDVKIELSQRMMKVRNIMRMRELQVDTATLRQLKEFEEYLSKPIGRDDTEQPSPRVKKRTSLEEMVEKRAGMSGYQLEREHDTIRHIERLLKEQNLLPNDGDSDNEPPNYEGAFAATRQFEDPPDYYTERRRAYEQREPAQPRPRPTQRAPKPPPSDSRRIVVDFEQDSSDEECVPSLDVSGGPIDYTLQKASDNMEVYRIEMHPNRPVRQQRRLQSVPDECTHYNGPCQECKVQQARYTCAGCGCQWYCSRKCQLNAWEAHSENCPEPDSSPQRVGHTAE